MNLLLLLYAEFFKIGLFAVGGGLATIPFLEELIDMYHWITQEDLINIIAVAESTPGAVGVNAATFMGYSTAGVLGGIIAVLGLITPSIIIIVIVAKIFHKFKSNSYVKAAFYGIRPVAAGIIGAAGISVAMIAFGIEDLITGASTAYLATVFNILLGLLFFFAIEKFKKHAIVYIAVGAILGILIV
ncbi:chromate transporter [Candidatus Epulonipiscium viviparus]|uniref:chromate transporter n=1 Tax=Candidatus Epulonipiscium viviparus TaxID=420336 RepID=UPI0027381251|nr:chromate transporter [Candidatus Epulopiscium viviparus]